MGNIVIIGASSGIGLALARQQTKLGHQVYGTFNKTEEDSVNGFSAYRKLDVLEDDLDLSFAPERVDGLIYCPGSVILKPFSRLKPTDFVADYQLQVVGAVKVIQALLPNLKKSSSASVVLFSTIAVQLGFNFHSLVSSSKGALEGLTKALAAELAPKIRVNCIAPSITDTPLAAALLSTDEKREINAQRHPLKKIGMADDVASAASFLLANDSTWITGQILRVDGGMSTLKI
jgi:NAD(P)-dependent dehydrogenase (short-subunit alcohol dehydrogenase family)